MHGAQTTPHENGPPQVTHCPVWQSAPDHGASTSICSSPAASPGQKRAVTPVLTSTCPHLQAQPRTSACGHQQQAKGVREVAHKTTHSQSESPH